jgi:hypothetical protein
MSNSHDRSTRQDRHSAARPSRKRRPCVEALEGRTLMTLNLAAASHLQGSGVQVIQVAIDTKSNAFVAGYYTGTANFGNDAGGNSVIKNNSTGNSEGFVAEYSPNGVVGWFTQFVNQTRDPSSQSKATSLAYDPATATVFVVGVFVGEVDFDPLGAGEIVTSSNDASADAYVVGLNASNGHLSNGLFNDFVQVFPGVAVGPEQVIIDPVDGGVGVTGFYAGGSIVVGSGSNRFSLASPPGKDTEGFTVKFNQNLVPQWAVNTTKNAVFFLDDSVNTGIAANAQQDIIYVVGDDSQNSTPFVEVLNDSNGNQIKTIEMTTTNVAVASGVVTDSAGNAYVVGTFGDNLMPTSTATPLVSAGGDDAFLFAFDSSLNELFGVRFGSSNADSADAVGIDGSGNLYISGALEGPFSFGPSKTAVILGNDPTGKPLPYVIEVSSKGTFESGAQATAASNTSFGLVRSLAVNPSGQVVVAGGLMGVLTLGSTQIVDAAGGSFIATLTSQTPSGGAGNGGSTATVPAFEKETRLNTGKGRKLKITGYQLVFTSALDPNTAQSTAHYRVTQPGRNKHSAPGNVAVLAASYNSSTSTVLLVLGKHNARKPLTLTATGLTGPAGTAVATFSTGL